MLFECDLLLSRLFSLIVPFTHLSLWRLLNNAIILSVHCTEVRSAERHRLWRHIDNHYVISFRRSKHYWWTEVPPYLAWKYRLMTICGSRCNVWLKNLCNSRRKPSSKLGCKESITDLLNNGLNITILKSLKFNELLSCQIWTRL